MIRCVTRPHVNGRIVRLSSIWYAIFVVGARVLVHLLIEKGRCDDIAQTVSGDSSKRTKIDRRRKGPALSVPNTAVCRVLKRCVVRIVLL